MDEAYRARLYQIYSQLPIGTSGSSLIGGAKRMTARSKLKKIYGHCIDQKVKGIKTKYKKAPSKWNKHVKAVAKKNPGMSFPQIVKKAKKTYGGAYDDEDDDYDDEDYEGGMYAGSMIGGMNIGGARTLDQQIGILLKRKKETEHKKKLLENRNEILDCTKELKLLNEEKKLFKQLAKGERDCKKAVALKKKRMEKDEREARLLQKLLIKQKTKNIEEKKKKSYMKKLLSTVQVPRKMREESLIEDLLAPEDLLTDLISARYSARESKRPFNLEDTFRIIAGHDPQGEQSINFPPGAIKRERERKYEESKRRINWGEEGEPVGYDPESGEYGSLGEGLLSGGARKKKMALTRYLNLINNCVKHKVKKVGKAKKKKRGGMMVETYY